MKKAKKLLSYSYFGFFTALLLSAPAFAYLDPGTVTYVVSMIAGLFIAGGAALAIFRRKIKLFFQNLGKKKDTTAAESKEDLGGEFDPMEEVDPMDDKKS